jgi:hypothetical protein
MTENQIRELYKLFTELYPTVLYNTYKRWLEETDPASAQAHASRVLITTWNGCLLTPNQFRECYEGFLRHMSYDKETLPEDEFLRYLVDHSKYYQAYVKEIWAFVSGYLSQEPKINRLTTL